MKILFAVIGGLVVFTIVMNLIVMSLETRKEDLANPVPTQRPTPTTKVRLKQNVRKVPTQPPKSPLAVKDVSITGGTEEASLLPTIDITFNKRVGKNSFIFSIDPNEAFDVTYREATASVSFREPLPQGEVFRYRINTFNQLPREFMFTTEDTTPENEITLRYQPEKYAHERLPYEDDTVLITSEYVRAEGRYRFDVRGNIRNESKVRDAAQQWFLSIGLDEEVFSKFWIIYW